MPPPFTPEQRLECVARVLSKTVTIVGIATELGVSRVTIHKWVRNFKCYGYKGLGFKEAPEDPIIPEPGPHQRSKARRAAGIEDNKPKRKPPKRTGLPKWDPESGMSPSEFKEHHRQQRLAEKAALRCSVQEHMAKYLAYVGEDRCEPIDLVHAIELAAEDLKLELKFVCEVAHMSWTEFKFHAKQVPQPSEDYIIQTIGIVLRRAPKGVDLEYLLAELQAYDFRIGIRRLKRLVRDYGIVLP
ncbi:MAG: helix-turn-helix domain-containing protein [Corynebacterium sp.]|nr:helix-turn-helix domain-containing protein [Corynebacterium sp.]